MTDLLLDALASWRLTRLLQRDEITRPARSRAIEWALANHHPQLRYLITCGHCGSVWTTAFVLVAKRLPGGKVLRNLLAVAGAVSVFTELEPSLTETDSPT